MNFGQFELPVYWHVFCPEHVSAAEKQRCLEALGQVQQNVQQALAVPHLREGAMREIQQYCDARRYTVANRPDSDCFRLAWENCYGGL